MSSLRMKGGSQFFLFFIQNWQDCERGSIRQWKVPGAFAEVERQITVTLVLLEPKAFVEFGTFSLNGRHT